MTSYLVHVLAAIAVWWLATGGVLIAARRGVGEAGSLMPAVSVLALGSLILILKSGSMETTAGAYAGFFGALGIWAWHETAFLTGFLTGPSHSPCPEGLTGWRRFLAAFETVRSHEFALFATLLGLAALMWQAPNQTGLWVFTLLWVMRVSAKLNIFLGAPNAISSLLPSRMAYLTSYFRTDSTSPFFLLTILASGAGFGFLCVAAGNADQAHGIAGYTLLATFMWLAIVEHLFLIIPISDSALWRWAVNGNEKQ